MSKVNEFFELKSFRLLLELLGEIGSRLGSVGDAQLDEICIRVRAIASLLDQYCSGLEVGMELSWPLSTLRRRVALLLEGRCLHPDLVVWHRGDPERLLELDCVTEGIETLPTPPNEVAQPGDAAPATAPLERTSNASADERKAVPSVRVTRPAVEQMLDLVRQLVLNKNQVESLVHSVRSGSATKDTGEALNLRAAEYARLVEQLRFALTAARVQPAAIVFDRYERMVREVAQLGEKELDLVIRGADTRVDKFVLDAVADPLGRILRSTASHAIETPEERTAAGKPRRATMRIDARDHASHVSISITHDGRRNGTTDSETDTDDETTQGTPPDASQNDASAQFIEDADTVGVLDALGEQGAHISVRTEGDWHTIRIALPVEGAVLGVMHVLIGGSSYAIPIGDIKEIVSVQTATLQSIEARPVLRVRDDIYSLVDCAARFGEGRCNDPGVAVVVAEEDRAIALRVDRVVGYQEVVIEPFGLDRNEHGPFLGATIKNDGAVGLVIDVARLLSIESKSHRSPAQGATQADAQPQDAMQS